MLDPEVKQEIDTQLEDKLSKKLEALERDFEKKSEAVIKKHAESKVDEAIEARMPEECTIKYMNFWAGTRVMNEIKKIDRKVDNLAKEMTKLATKEEISKLATKEEISKLATKEEVGSIKEEVGSIKTILEKIVSHFKIK